MNKEQFLNYFKKKENNNDKDDVTITNVISPATSEVTNAELAFVSQEFDKSAGRPKNYQKNIPENVRKEVGKYAFIHGTSSAIKRFSSKYPKYSFIWTSVNNWKNKFKGGRDNVVLKNLGRPNILNDCLIRKVKDVAIGTQWASGTINRRQIINIGKGVVRENNPDILEEFGGILKLTVKWARGILNQLNWSKRKGTTRKVEPSA